MAREQYIIIRRNWVPVPFIADYLGHGDTPYDMDVRYTSFRDSATRYSNKREAIRQAKQSANVFPNHEYEVRGFYGLRTVWTTCKD